MIRTYAGGRSLAFRFHGRKEQGGHQPGEPIIIGRTYPVGPDGAVAHPFTWMDTVEVRLEPVSGRVSARGS